VSMAAEWVVVGRAAQGSGRDYFLVQMGSRGPAVGVSRAGQEWHLQPLTGNEMPVRQAQAATGEILQAVSRFAAGAGEHELSLSAGAEAALSSPGTSGQQPVPQPAAGHPVPQVPLAFPGGPPSPAAPERGGVRAWKPTRTPGTSPSPGT
jgi:hypothetical protein